MASGSENTPFLADNDHRDSYDEAEGGFTKIPPANAHFRRPIRILTGVVSFLSLSIFGLLIASYILLNVGPFEWNWGSKEAIQDLAICVSNLSYFIILGRDALHIASRVTCLLSAFSYS
jgi:hypothetical protein